MKRFLKAEYFFLFLLIGTYFTVFSALSILRHLSLNSTYLDLGLESQAIWNTSQGRLFETSFGGKGELISAFSYHMTPIILVLAPIYKLFPSPIMLLFVQTLILALGAVPVFLICQHILKRRTVALAFATSYLLYPPIQYSNLSDFHYVTLATTFLLLTYYFLIKQRWQMFSLFLMLSVSTKENIALVAAVIGIYLFFLCKERRKGIIVFFTSAVYFLVTVYLVFPRLGGGAGAAGRYDYLGRNVWEILANLLTNPGIIAGTLLVRPKIIYLVHLFASVGFLSILSPVTLLLAVSEFFLNLFSAYNPQWQVKFHYTAAITPFVFISAIYGTDRLLKFFDYTKFKFGTAFIVVYLVGISIIWNIIHSPSPINYKFDARGYIPTQETAEAGELLKSIPQEASVSAMNNLGAHLSNRSHLYRFPIHYLDADYVVVDPYAISSNYDLSQVTPAEYIGLSTDLLKSGKFEMIMSQQRLLLYKKKL